MIKFLKTTVVGLLALTTLAFGAEGEDRMLKEKIGQMLIMGFKGESVNQDSPIVKAILAKEIGGVILFDYDTPTHTYNRNIKSPEQLQTLTQDLQRYAKEASSFPLFISVDYEGGKVNRLKAPQGFPATQSAEEMGKMSPIEVETLANSMATTLNQLGINLNYAPVLDLNLTQAEGNPIGRLGRSFSDNPNIVSMIAKIFSHAYQTHHVLCTYKHFPGHGSSLGDTHQDFVDITKTWKGEAELHPYEVLLHQPYGCPLVMMAHVVNTTLDEKYPASLSYEINQKLLRDRLKFNGVVITDDMQMGAIAKHFGVQEAVRLAINSGADILIFANQLVPVPQDPKELVEMIYQDVKAGRIPESRIDESYRRIMKVKKMIQ